MNERMKKAIESILEHVEGSEYFIMGKQTVEKFAELRKAFDAKRKKTTPEIRTEFLRQCCINHTENEDDFSLEVLRKTGEHYLLCLVEGRSKGFLIIPRFNDCHDDQKENIVATVLDHQGEFVTVFNGSDKGAMQTAKAWLIEGWGDEDDDEALKRDA